jgi:anti-sigma factor RsiW
MTDAHIQDDQLQEHFDGELAPAARTNIVAHLASCDGCSKRYAKLEKLHMLFSMASEDVSHDLHADALFGRIERGIAEAKPEGIFERLTSWLTDTLGSKSPIWVPATAAVALGAMLLTFYLPGGGELPSRSTDVSPVVREPAPAATAQANTTTQAAVPASNEVVQVDSGQNQVAVITVDLDSGGSTPVVWINDEMGL